MPGTHQLHSSIFHALAHLLVAALVITILVLLAVVPAWTQSVVPPTAREAAASPEFASRLASRVTPEAAGKARAPGQHQAGRVSPLDSGVIYENGPVNGTTDAWTINFGYIVSDSFTLATGSTVTGFDFYAWEFPGDTLGTVDWSITSGENGGTVFGSGTVHVTDTFVSTNQYGYDTDKISASGLNVNLPAGTFWFNLQNASVPSGDPVYWDENSGIGCKSPGCPSKASESAVGTIPSEAFDIVGNNNGPPPWPETIYDFTGGADGSYPSAPVTMDRAGSLYGTTAGPYCHECGMGSVYKLVRQGSGWIFDLLYSFAGDSDGPGSFSPVVIAPDGSLYGVECGYYTACDVIFNLKPPATACLTAMCSWTKTVIYRFLGGSDGSGSGDLTLDAAGNIYGATGDGGAYGQGTIYKLTRSSGGWTKSTIYDFQGPPDGASPIAVIFDQAGNLYGTTGGGGAYGWGTVFQLQPSLSGWTENILHSFPSGSGLVGHLTIDASGKLYGSTSGDYGYRDYSVYMLTPSGSDWTFNFIYYLGQWSDLAGLGNVVVDASGNVYSSVGQSCALGRTTGIGNGACAPSLPDHVYAGVFELTPQPDGTWTLTTLNTTPDQLPGFLRMGADGRVYGTSHGGGLGPCEGKTWDGCGVVWRTTQ